MKKRVSCALLVLALTVSLFAGFASAAGNLTVVTDKSSYTAGDTVKVTLTADSDLMIEVFYGDASGNKVISSVTSSGGYSFKTASAWAAGTYTVVVGAGSNTASCTFALVASEEGGGTETCHYTVKVTGPAGTLYPETEKSLSSGQTVMDALEATGLAYSVSGIYVSSICGISEFDYGSSSGWMYRVYDSSGAMYPSAATTAANEFYLSDGDQVEWYYTCNYNTDGTYDSGMWTSGGTTALTAGSDGSASVGADDLSGFVKAGLGLTVNADAGSLILTPAGASALAEEIGSGTLTVSISKTDGEKSGFSVVSDSKTIIALDISITAGNIKITDGIGTVSVIVKVGKIYAGQTLSILHLKENGKYEILTGNVDADGMLSFDTTSLSTFVVFETKDVPVEYVFNDVEAGAWYADYVRYVYSNGIMTGTSAAAFEPETAISRAMLVTVLYRMDGKPAVTGASGFTDVTDAAAWYCNAVVWAVSNRIVNGYGDGLFGPGDNVTRQEMVTIFYRYAQYKGYSTGSVADISAYSDAGSVSGWAVNAFRWAVKSGIISGTSATTLSPSAGSCRCEAAAVIMRFLELAQSPGAGDAAAAAAYDKAAQYCLSSSDPAYGSEWEVVGLSDGGYPLPGSWKSGYYNALCEYLVSCGGKLSTRKYTEYSRVILALAAAGYDPADVAGYDLTAPLKDYDSTVYQGLNGPVWALIALDRVNCYSDLRQKYVDYILVHELKGGGWALSGTAADPDMTAMALRALINYTGEPDVKEAISRGIKTLSEMQEENGGYSACGGANSESCAQVIWTLCKLGISLDDARFIKNGNTLLDCLLSYQLADGSFEHTAAGGSNIIATEQALCALASAVRLYK